MDAPRREYRKTRVKRLPRAAVRETAESRYWAKLKNPVLVHHNGPVNSVHFSPIAPHSFAAAASVGVHVYKPKSATKQKTISRFKDIAYSPQFRGDGQLLAAGGEQKHVQVFEMATRSILRQFKGHKEATHVVRWSADNLSVGSGSDDKTVCIWDLTEPDKALHVLRGHEDYVRALAASPSSPQIWASGGYDHVVKCWDTRMDPGDGDRNAYCSLDHGAPVEALLYFPSGSVLVSAGGNEIKVWDMLGGSAGNLLHTSAHHLKAVTSLCLDGTASRLITGSLDGHVKVCDVATYSVTYSLKYASPVLGVGISKDNSCLAVAMNDGMLGIRTRHEAKSSGMTLRPTVQHAGSHRWQTRGKNVGPGVGDLAIAIQKKPKLRQYDKFLKSFQFQNALSAALEMKTSVITVSLLEELDARGALQVALSGRNEDTLAPLLEFLMKNITNPQYSALLINITNSVLGLLRTHVVCLC